MSAGPGNRAVVLPASRPGDGGGPASGPSAAPDTVSTLWRGIVLVAVISLFIGTHTAWADPWTALVVIVGYAGILLCAALAVTLRTAAAMRRLEYGVLGLAVLHYIGTFPRVFPARSRTLYPGDEGTLTDLAGTALRHLSDPYARSWPQAFPPQHPGLTLTLSGHVITRFEYPPLPAILDALVQPFTHGLATTGVSGLDTEQVIGVPTAGVIGIAALGLTAVLLFFLLPSPWRAVAPTVCLSLALYEQYARSGEPAIVALPLLMLAFYRWTSIGHGGRLGWAGWISAVSLGLAAATQQLAWFVAPFLVTAIFLVRRADMPAGAAARLAGAYTAVVTATFAAVNVPFMVWNVGDWLRGVGAPLTQRAIPNGQGLIGVTYYLIGGSGALGFYSYAAALYAVALLACFGLYFRGLGPAVAVLPCTIFFFPARSQVSYFLLFVGLWVISLLTVDRALIGRAHQLGGRLRGRLRLDTRARAVAVTALFLPAVACLGIAVGTPQPLRLAVARPTYTGPQHLIETLTVTATNTSGHAVAPHFVLSANTATTAQWVIKSGPATLPPGSTATYVITAPFDAAAGPPGVPVELRAFSSTPDSLSSVTVATGRYCGPVPCG